MDCAWSVSALALVSHVSCHFTAAAPLHWIYDQSKVNSLTDGGKNYAYLPESHCPFYRISSGEFSAYGDQLFVTLKSIAEKKGVYVQRVNYLNCVQ